MKQIPLSDLLVVPLKCFFSQCVGYPDNPNAITNEFVVYIAKLPSKDEKVFYRHVSNNLAYAALMWRGGPGRRSF